MAQYRDERSWYNVMQACTNGHIITSTARDRPENLKKRCPQCGAKTITQCPNCNTDIQGYKHIPGVAHGGPKAPPDFCHECGAAYPWTVLNQQSSSDSTAAPIPAVHTNDVFVVHGHDNEMKQHVARVLSTLGMNPIMLHEQPNQGRTLIEKFEKNANVQMVHQECHVSEWYRLPSNIQGTSLPCQS